MNILVDQRDRGLGERKIAGAENADDAIARFLVDPHLAAHRDIIHARAGARVGQENRAGAAKHPEAIGHALGRPALALIRGETFTDCKGVSAVRISNTGRTNAFRMPSKSAAPINAPAVSYRIPLMNTGATITATVVIIQRKTKCRMAARYSKFLASRNRFAKSACNTRLVSRLGTQSETATRG